MIDHTDIDAFKEDFDRLAEFVRRAEKGLPPDRWVTGDDGHKALAISCKRVLAFSNLQAAVMASMHEDMVRVGMSAMEASPDPCR